LKRGHAPDGFYTFVEIYVTLANGVSRVYAWSTPMSMNAAMHKAPRWAKQNMRKEQVRGRSTIVRIDLIVKYERGKFRNRK
jgi:hypothetical protein